MLSAPKARRCCAPGRRWKKIRQAAHEEDWGRRMSLFLVQFLSGARCLSAHSRRLRSHALVAGVMWSQSGVHFCIPAALVASHFRGVYLQGDSPWPCASKFCHRGISLSTRLRRSRCIETDASSSMLWGIPGLALPGCWRVVAAVRRPSSRSSNALRRCQMHVPYNASFTLDRPLTEEKVASRYNNFYAFSAAGRKSVGARQVPE